MLKFETRKEAVIWAAGFLEGEGSFGIYPNGTGGGYLGKVSAGQVDLRPLEILRDLFGGCITKDKRSHQSRFSTALLSEWQITGPSMYEALTELHPYLLQKQEQAECIIELYTLIAKWKEEKGRLSNSKRSLTREEQFERVLLYVRCKDLNNKHGSAATTKREGLDESQASDSLNCIDEKDAESVETAGRLAS